MFGIKGLTKSEVLAAQKCPHCGKSIEIDFKIDHEHRFEHKVETTNLLREIKLNKLNVK